MSHFHHSGSNTNTNSNGAVKYCGSYVEYVDIGGIDLLWFGQAGLLYVILRPTDPSHVLPQVGVGKEVV